MSRIQIVEKESTEETSCIKKKRAFQNRMALNRAFQNRMALSQVYQNRLYKKRGLKDELWYGIGAAQAWVAAESGERNESVCDLSCQDRVFWNEREISLKDSDRF